jgi:hypothetical protein
MRQRRGHFVPSASALIFLTLVVFLTFPSFISSTLLFPSIEPVTEFIFVLKSSPDITPQAHLNNQINTFLSLIPSAKIIQTYSSLVELNFLAFTVQCSFQDIEIILQNNFIYKFYEESSSLMISRSLVKTVPFVSQYLRSESHTLGKNGFCTFSYESYQQFLLHETDLEQPQEKSDVVCLFRSSTSLLSTLTSLCCLASLPPLSVGSL